MENKTCQMCGGTLILDFDRQHYTCDSCGLKFDANLSFEEKREIEETEERLEDKLDLIMLKKKSCKEQLEELESSKSLLNKLLVGICAGLLAYVFFVFFCIAVTKAEIEKLWPMWFCFLSFISWIVSSTIFSNYANPFGKKNARKALFWVAQIYSCSLLGLICGLNKYFKTCTQIKKNDELKKELNEKIQHYIKEENKIKQQIDY